MWKRKVEKEQHSRREELLSQSAWQAAGPSRPLEAGELLRWLRFAGLKSHGVQYAFGSEL